MTDANQNVPPLTGTDSRSIEQWARTTRTNLNEFMRRQTTGGAFHVWNDGCVTIPNSTTISGAQELVFESPFAGYGTFVVTVVGASGNVHVALNDVDLGTLSDPDTTSEILYEVQLTGLVDGLNSFKIWSTSTDGDELRRLEVWRNFTREEIDGAGTTADWGSVTGAGKPEDNADVTSAHADDIIHRQSAAPSSPNDGWLWQDTDDLLLYRWLTSAWQQIGSDDALLLSSNAPAEGSADATVNNADSIIFWQSSAPSSPQDGWIWVDTDDGSVYQRRSAAWQFIGADDALILQNAPAEAGADVTGPRLMALNNPTLEAGQTGWSNTSEIINDAGNARSGSWAIQLDSYSGTLENTNDTVIQVEPGDRVLAQCFTKRAGSVVTGGRVKIRWEDASGGFVDQDLGNKVTSTSYSQSRAVAVAPASTVRMTIRARAEDGDGTANSDQWFDGFFAVLLPKDADIDALLTSNAPAEAGADVTGNNTAAGFTGQGNLATQDAAEIIFRQSSAPGSPVEGWIWYDTDDGVVYRRGASAWQQIGADDPLLLTFNAVAEAAADVTGNNADSIIFYQSAAPSSPQDGWIWVDTDDGAIYQRRSAAWQFVGSDDALALQNAAAEASADVTANNADAIIFYQSAAPSSPQDGWIWVDTDDGSVYQRRSAAWQFIGADDALILQNAPAESGADATGPRLMALNNPNFEAGQTGWDVTSGITNDAGNARVGSWALKTDSFGALLETTNDTIIQVEPGDRVLAQCFSKRVGSTVTSGAVKIRWEDASGGFIGQEIGDQITSTSYAQSRAVGVAPASTVRLTIRARSEDGDSTSNSEQWYDGFFVVILPKDVDIDALGTTNAPAEANADATSGHADDIVFSQSAAPSSPQAGWVWHDIDDDNVYRRNNANTAWVFIGSADALQLTNAPAEADADVTANNADNIVFRQSSAPSSPQEGWIWIDTDDGSIYRRTGAAWTFIGSDDALTLDNAPAEADADVTGSNLSQTDWGTTQTFTPTWSGFSTDPSGDLSYAISEDSRRVIMWAASDLLGTSNAAAISISNLPSAIRPSGSSFIWASGTGGGQRSTGVIMPITAKIWEASHASAGTCEFGSYDHGTTGYINFDLAVWASGQSAGLLKGATLTWFL